MEASQVFAVVKCLEAAKDSFGSGGFWAISAIAEGKVTNIRIRLPKYGAVMNSFALDKYGISAETRTPHGVIVCTEEVRQHTPQVGLRRKS